MSRPTLKTLEAERNRIKTRLAQIGDMRPGSLVGRFRKCGRPNCHCAEPDSPGHGPSWSLTRQVHGKTVTTVIPPGPDVERAKEQIDEYHRFRQLIQQLVEVNVKICDYQLRHSRRPDGVKKNASEKRHRQRHRQGS